MATGELRWVALGEIAQPCSVEDCLATLTHLVGGYAALFETEGNFLDDGISKVGHVRGGVLLDYGGVVPLAVHLRCQGGQACAGVPDHLHRAVLVERLGEQCQIHSTTPKHASGMRMRAARWMRLSWTGCSTVRGPVRS